MKHLTLIIIALLFSVSALAQQTIEADFTQTRVMKVSGKTTEKTGHLTFDGNDRLEMLYTDPEDEYFIIDGMTVKINLDGKKAELDAEKVKMVQRSRPHRNRGRWRPHSPHQGKRQSAKRGLCLCRIDLSALEQSND